MPYVDAVRRWCLALPGATEDVKWEDNLVFSVGGRMFAMVGLEPPHRVSFKCDPETFADLVEREGIVPAPYLARAHWVSVESAGEAVDDSELRARLAAAYDTIRAKLPRKAQEALKLRGGKRR